MTGTFVVGAFDISDISSDMDFGVWRYDGSAWTQVFDKSGTHEDDIADIGNISRIPNGHLFLGADGDATYAKSTDQGLTWQLGENSSPFTKIAPFGFPFGIDENGKIWEVKYTNLGPPPFTDHRIVSTDDIGANWVDPAYALAHAAEADFGNDEVDSTWASNGNVWWNERYFVGGVGHASIVNKTLLDVPMPDTARYLVRGLYNTTRIYAFGDFYNRAFYYEPDAMSPTLVEITLPTMDTNSLYSFVPFSDMLWFIAETGNTHVKVHKTDDGGASWTTVLDKLYSDSNTLFPDAGISEGSYFIDRNPADPSEMLVVAKGGLFHSTDTGDTWTLLAGPTTDIEFSCVQFIGASQSQPRTWGTVIGGLAGIGGALTALAHRACGIAVQ